MSAYYNYYLMMITQQIAEIFVFCHVLSFNITGISSY